MLIKLFVIGVIKYLWGFSIKLKMKIYKPKIVNGMLLQLNRMLDDIKDEQIREYQESKRFNTKVTKN